MTAIVIQDGTEDTSGSPECAGGTCPKCAAHERSQEMAFAFLLALMPVISLTLFGQAGLL